MYNFLIKIFQVFTLLKVFTYYRWIFYSFGQRSKIYRILKLTNPQYISIGDGVTIADFSWLGAKKISDETKLPILEIKANSKIGHFNHIYATSSVIIEEGVLTADKVYISDNSHEYSDINTAILDQDIKQLKKVIIGEGSWLGENVCVSGACIGKHCIIGANSVVNKDIPDYCIAAGAPAKIVKRYNFETERWQKTDSKGNFINYKV